MELRQPRPFGAEGRKSTHDFLSLYSPVQQDPRPTSQGAYLKTHDFLQPLEGLGKNITKEENSTVEIITTLDKPPLPAPPPITTSGEHLLPGGIGTYSISHISNYFNQTVLKPEGAAAVFTVAQSSSTDRNEENSNSSSFNTGSGFTLWEESAVKKGKTGKENVACGDSKRVSKADPRMAEERVNIRRGALGGGIGGGGQWATSGQRPSQSSSNHVATNHRNATTTFSSLSSSQPPSSQKNQTFMDMLKSAKVSQDDDDDDEEEFVFKKEPSPYPKNDLSVKLAGEGGKSNDQKPNTPRSKHSATEQRRRSKINDRFQMLRDLIPHSDQKRDKASFLLEVIEYIQFLQEKVDKYEVSYQGWNQEPPKLTPWKNNQSSVEGFVDQSRATNSGSGPKLTFAAKFDEDNIVVSPNNPQNGHNGIESDLSTVTTLKEIDLRTVLTNKAVPLSLPLQPNMLTPTGSSSLMVPIPAGVTSGMDNVMSQPQSPFLQSRSHATDNTVARNKLKEQELTIESGKICISSVYSQGLLNTLTQALQSSGIDLSQASISVQIDLGKRANGRLPASTSTAKDVVARSRAASSEEESDQALKRLKKS